MSSIVLEYHHMDEYTINRQEKKKKKKRKNRYCLRHIRLCV